MKTAIRPLLVGLAILSVGGCGGSEESPSAGEMSQSTPATTSSATATTSSSDVPQLVGRWKRVHRCPELVTALNDAGLGKVAPAMVGDYFPDTPAKQLAQKADVCAGAKPMVHYHFFNEAGAFGSLDENEQQVDDGPYEIVDDRTFVIGSPGVRFHYEIADDVLSLSPVVTRAMKREALAHPLEFSDAGWAVAVTYPGQTWERVDCGVWC